MSDDAELLVSYPSIDGLPARVIEVLTINRPQARNALTHQTYALLESAVRNSDARCIVITAVDPAFCSGDDVRQVMAPTDRPNPAERLTSAPRLTPAADALLHCDVPIVAAVNGAAVGWGMELAMMADIRVASDRAKFGELFVLRGLVSDVAGLGRLASLVGRERAAELLLTGRIIDATEAHRIGLVSQVVDHDSLMASALLVAGRIAANPPLATRAIKQGLRQALDPDWTSLGEWVSATLGQLFQTADHREGVASFLEKRPAHFTGR
jgi:enoyl-CoA hydratase/carnithine racemase